MSRSIRRPISSFAKRSKVCWPARTATARSALWSVGGEDIWLDSYVTDFLTRARERKIAVPDAAFKLALNRLRNAAANTTDPGKNGGADLAYALYVLARNGLAPVGDLRYIADAKLDALATPIAKAQIAAALAMVGDRTRAERVYNAALTAISPPVQADPIGREDYGSALRDAAALVALASEGGAPHATVQAAVQRVESLRADLHPTSTQEDAWLLLAASTMAKDAGKISLDVGGESVQRPLYRTIAATVLKEPLRVSNGGEDDVRAVVTVTGAPLTPEPPAEKGFKIERQTYTLDGDPADAKKVKQNTRLVVVLKVTEGQPQFGRVIVADYLPAGFEIDNPHLVSSGDTGTLSWITDAVAPANAEFRDDRFTAAFDRKKDDAPVFTVAYVVRAVAPGKYVRPQASVEDMYRPDRFGRTATKIRKSRRRNDGDGQCLLPREVVPSDAPLVRGADCDLPHGWRCNHVLDFSLGPPPDGKDLQFSPWVTDRNGRLLRAYTTNDGRWRLPARIADVDPRFFDLLFAFEDRRFREHHGVDALALVRAAVQLVGSGRIRSGGSTLTMQVARLLEPRNGRTLAAKIHQIVRAVEIERTLTKDQIVSLYLELAPYGGNIEGIRAASLAYFGKEPRRLTLGEAALLVALPQSPEARRPDRSVEAARAARDRVIERFAALSRAPADEISAAKAEAVPSGRRPMPMLAPHAADRAIAESGQGGEVRLTIDADLQRSLEELARERARGLALALGPDVSLAMLVIDNKDGAVVGARRRRLIISTPAAPAKSISRARSGRPARRSSLSSMALALRMVSFTPRL